MKRLGPGRVFQQCYGRIGTGMPAGSGPWLMLAVLVPGWALAADPSITLRYDVRYGPLRLMSMRVTTEVDATRYRSSTFMQTEGIIGTFFPWTSESEVVGVRDGTRLKPERHRTNGRYRNEERLVEIDYGPDGRVRSRVEPPPEDDWRTVVPQSLQDDTVDPLTASLHAAGGDCAGRLAVFDGRRRYDLKLTSLAPVELPPAPPRLYTGPTRRCRAQVEALAGFWRSDPRDSEEPTYLDYWLAVAREGLPPVPVYIELAGARGTLRIDLVGIETGSRPYR